MLSGLRIDIAKEDDVPVILDFIQGLADYERLRDKCVATEEKLRRTLFGNRPAAEVLIARVDEVPVGFALFFHNYSTFLAQPGVYLEDLFVDTSARGKGIGKMLLSALAQIAIERDCGRVEWAVLDWNEDAIGFYRRLGATPMDEWTTYRLSGESLTALASEFPRLND